MALGYTQIYSFTVHKGVNNVFRFQIKKNGSPNPLDLSSGASLTAYLYLLKDDSLVFTKPLAVDDATNGEMSLTITSSEADTLYEEHYPFSADNFVPKAVYKLLISGTAAENGDMIIRIPRVYVD